MKLNKLYAYLLLLLVILFSCGVSTIEGMEYGAAAAEIFDSGQATAYRNMITTEKNALEELKQKPHHPNGFNPQTGQYTPWDNPECDRTDKKREEEELNMEPDRKWKYYNREQEEWNREQEELNREQERKWKYNNREKKEWNREKEEWNREQERKWKYNNREKEEWNMEQEEWNMEQEELNMEQERKKEEWNREQERKMKEDYLERKYNNLEKEDDKNDSSENFDNRYILKSQVVPPVCPACPQTTGCPKTKACQPCAPCARCPEPSFDCKKVPNYNAIGRNALPMAYLNSFSAF